jgi:hypothetical protein
MFVVQFRSGTLEAMIGNHKAWIWMNIRFMLIFI